MSKKNRKKNRQAQADVQVLANAPLGDKLQERVDKLSTAVAEAATDADRQATASAPATSTAPTVEELDALATKLFEAKNFLDAREKRADEQQERIDRDGDKLKTERGKLTERARDLSAKEKKLDSDTVELDARQEAIAKREADADAGFSSRNRDALAKLEEEAQALRDEMDRRRKTMADARLQFDQDRDERLAELAAKTQSANDAERQALSDERMELEQRAAEVRKQERELATEKELFVEDRDGLDARVAQRAAYEMERKDQEIEQLREQVRAARDGRKHLEEQLAEREEADCRFGGETPEDVLRRVEGLEQENARLKKELGQRLGSDAERRLVQLEREEDQWISDRESLEIQLFQAKSEATTQRIAVTELEAVRDQKSALESANRLLREAHDQLALDVDKMIAQRAGIAPFPSCSAMDSDEKLQTRGRASNGDVDLKEFAEYVRARMASGADGARLYYSPQDVRSFIGGMAMSPLLLLQGISGTGKTSLPRVFAKAIDAECEVVAVQAGWRDRQDLLGHFNTFERRFHETEFMKALYKARTPYCSSRPFIIVLDEMNLSHPEQYFADLLSTMEMPSDQRQVSLGNPPLEKEPPIWLREHGTVLSVPRNVWFVGTANHDETTKDFADKTYDRAYVAELPRHYDEFEPSSVHPRDPVSFEKLSHAFENAEGRKEGDGALACAFLNGKLRDFLGRWFQIGWGNRLDRQMATYVPVVVVAGGTVGEAVDQILAMKLLRKLRDRYDNRPEKVRELRDLIQEEWQKLGRGSAPVRSTTLLDEELRRLGEANDE